MTTVNALEQLHKKVAELEASVELSIQQAEHYEQRAKADGVLADQYRAIIAMAERM